MMAQTRSVYDRILDDIRTLESRIPNTGDYFLENYGTSVTEIAELLKEAVFVLEDYEKAHGKSPKVRRYVDDLPMLINRLSEVIDRKKSSLVGPLGASVKRFSENVRKSTVSGDANLVEENDALREQVRQYELQAETREYTTKKIDKVKSVEASKEWSTYYEKHVECKADALYSGSKPKNWFARLYYWGDNFYLLERKWAQWRSVWLSSLVILSALLLVYSAFQIWHGAELLNVALGKLLALPLYVVLGIGFAFASRNFRISANLLADYRHKQIVAKVLENVILSNALEEKDGLKVDLLQQGAKSLFIAKNVGHLDKEAVEEFPIIELIKAIKK